MNLEMDIGHGKTVIFSPKQNEFVCIVGHGSESFAAFLNEFVCIVGHGSESFAAFLNEVILQTNKKRGIDHCSSHHNTSRECIKI